MSGRGMTSAMQAQLAASRLNTAHLLAVDFDGWVYLTDYSVPLAWNGQTYLASQFLTFSEVKETNKVLVDKCTVALSGVDQSIIAILLQDTYFRRRAKVYKAAVTLDQVVISDPLLVVDGHLDRPVIATDPGAGTCSASVDVINMFGQYAAPAGRHTNDAEQQFWFPGDKGFEYVSGIPQQIFWGVLQNARFSHSGPRGGGHGGEGYPGPYPF